MVQLIEPNTDAYPENWNADYEKGFCDAINKVLKLPIIEAEPVRRGRWETWGYVFHGIEWKRCSCCGKCADVSYYGLLDGEIKMSTPSICGCCGARMDATDTEVDRC
jgi:hypothetical protein